MNDAATTLLDGAWRARREGRIPDAQRDIARALEISRVDDDPAILVRSLHYSAQMERDAGNGAAAIPIYVEAIALARTCADPLLLAHQVRHLGDVYQDAGRLADAEPCYAEALELYRASPDRGTLDLANAVRPMAILKGAAGDLDAARTLWTEARDLYAEVGIQAGVDEATEHLTRIEG